MIVFITSYEPEKPTSSVLFPAKFEIEIDICLNPRSLQLTVLLKIG